MQLEAPAAEHFVQLGSQATHTVPFLQYPSLQVVQVCWLLQVAHPPLHFHVHAPEVAASVVKCKQEVAHTVQFPELVVHFAQFFLQGEHWLFPLLKKPSEHLQPPVPLVSAPLTQTEHVSPTVQDEQKAGQA